MTFSKDLKIVLTCGSVLFVTSSYLTSGCSWITRKFGLDVFTSSWETSRLVMFVNFQSPDSWRKLRRYLVASQSTAGKTKDEGEDWRISCNKFINSLFTCIIIKHKLFLYILNLIFKVRNHHGKHYVSSCEPDAGCRLLLERDSVGTLVLLLFLHPLGASLRHSVTSNSYCPFHTCGGRQETDDIEVLKLRMYWRDRLWTLPEAKLIRPPSKCPQKWEGSMSDTSQVPAALFSTESHFA